MQEVLKSNCVIADNWSLQLIAQALAEGLDPGSASLLEIDRPTESHGFREVPAGVFAIEAIFDLLADIVLREQIWVDENFKNTWEGKSSSLDRLLTEGILVPFRFLGQPQELEQPREHFLSQLCCTRSLREAQLENELGWKQSRNTPHPLLSQLVWGGAGMLARALVYRLSYTPSPPRRRMLVAANVAWTDDSASVLRELISQKQANVTIAESRNARITRLKINGADIASLAIRESSTPQSLLNVALQLRSDYAELRAWLGEYQQALESRDTASIARYEKLLRSVSDFVDTRLGRRPAGGPTFTLGWGLMQIATQTSPVEELMNRFGVRAQINRLVFAQPSLRDLDKLLMLFDIRTQIVGLRIAEHFRS